MVSHLVVLLVSLLYASSTVIEAKCLASKIKFDIYKDFKGTEFETVKASTKHVLREAKKVVITNQNVPVLCKDLFSTSNLELIEVSHSNLEAIEIGAFVRLPYLTILLLNNNNLKEIPAQVFDSLENASVRRLNLSNNAIEKIAPDVFAKLYDLAVIDLTNNKLAYIDGNWFKTNERISWLIFDNNHIETLQEGAFKFDVDGINLDIYMRNNSIKTIEPNAIQNVKTLGTFFLDGNKIETIPNMFKNVGEVKVIYLANNKIRCINEKEMKENLKICQEVFLQDNPLDCACWKEMKKNAQPLNIHLNALSRTVECYRERIHTIQKDNLF